MDVQTQDCVPVSSEKEQLSAPPGWTKKLVPARAKSITLRKHDVVFIAPDGQEVKSKWHLSRYLKAHPGGPASSEFNWSSGEEGPIRRSTRVVTKEDKEVDKSMTRKKGKRNASEMDSEEKEMQKEKPQARKRAKKAGKSAGVDGGAVKDAADVLDEVMHEAPAGETEATHDALPVGEEQKEENEENEATLDALPVDEAQKEENESEKVTEVEASKDAVTEKPMDDELDFQGEAEKDVPNEATEEDNDLTEVTGVEVKEAITESGVHAEKAGNTAQETATLVAPSGEGAAVESEQPVEHADDRVMEEAKENLDQKAEVTAEVSCKVTMVSSVVEEIYVKPLDPLMQKEEPLGPLVQKEEQERPPTNVESSLKMEHIKERSPSEFNSSPVPVSVANQ